ncbi:MAG: DUF4290 domain-containing protein [Prevotella sp.]|nr:DUF4290 domain-containing protein [Prevotella sp.]
MEITGLDYNTQREQLRMPEYGRDVQQMVDYCCALTDKAERQRCAEDIISVMRIMSLQRHTANLEQKLWNHLAVMSNFTLDIDYPYEVRKQEDFMKRPQPLPYDTNTIRKRHYGHLLEELIQKVRQMPKGAERDELLKITANQMRRSLQTWNHGTSDSEKVASDLAQYTDGEVQLDIEAEGWDMTTYNTPQPRGRKGRR